MTSGCGPIAKHGRVTQHLMGSQASKKMAAYLLADKAGVDGGERAEVKLSG